MAGNFPFTNEIAPQLVEDTGWKRRNQSLRCENPYGLLPKDNSIEEKVFSELNAILPWALAMPNDLIYELSKHAGVISEYSEIDSITPPYGLAVKQWLSDHVRLDRNCVTLCGYVGSPKVGSLNFSFTRFCEAEGIPFPKRRSAFKANLERSLIELGIDRSQGVFSRKERNGWVFYGLSLEKKKGVKIDFKAPEIWTTLYNQPVLRSLDKGGVIKEILYNGSRDNDIINKPNFVDLETIKSPRNEKKEKKGVGTLQYFIFSCA